MLVGGATDEVSSYAIPVNHNCKSGLIVSFHRDQGNGTRFLRFKKVSGQYFVELYVVKRFGNNVYLISDSFGVVI